MEDKKKQNSSQRERKPNERKHVVVWVFYSAFSSALKTRSELFSLLFDLRVHKPPSLNVPPPTPKTGKDFPSNINPINACWAWLQEGSLVISSRQEEKKSRLGKLVRSWSHGWNRHCWTWKCIWYLPSWISLVHHSLCFSMRLCGAVLKKSLRKCEAPSRMESFAFLTPRFRKVVKIWWRPHLHQVSSLCDFICWQLNNPRHQQRSPVNYGLTTLLCKAFPGVTRWAEQMERWLDSSAECVLCTLLIPSAPDNSSKNADIMYRLP